MIPDAAVEAAAQALYRTEYADRDLTDALANVQSAYRADARAVLSAALPLLGAAPSATRDEVARLIDPSGWRYFDTGMFPPDHPASTGVVHNSRETADALLAQFTITPRTDR